MLKVLREEKGCSHVKGACCRKGKGAPVLKVLREGKGCSHVKGAAGRERVLTC